MKNKLPTAVPKPRPKPAPATRQYSSIVDRRTHSEKIAASQRLRSTTPPKKGRANQFSSEHQPANRHTGPRKRHQTPDQRFDAKWAPEPNTACHIWSGALNPGGYGVISVRGERIAHRFAWARVNGPIPDGVVVDHICRVRSCVNPDHLRLLTPRENVLEAQSRSPTAIHSRKTCCPKCGGPYTKIGPNARDCMACRRLHDRRPRPGRKSKRRKTDFARIYGSKARVEFVKSLPCVARTPTCEGPIDNAHVADDGTKGAGRKSGSCCIAPLCRRHHHNLHVLGAKSFEIAYNVDLRTAAARTELAWREHEFSKSEVG